MAKWMALLVLCPKTERDLAKKDAEENGLSDYQIALRHRIPEIIVQSLFSDFYESAHDIFVA